MSDRRRPYPGGRAGARPPRTSQAIDPEAVLSEEEVQRRVNVEGGGRLVPPPPEHKFRDRRPTPVAPRRPSRSAARDSILLLALVVAGLVAIGILLPAGPLTASVTASPSPDGSAAAVAPSAASVEPVQTGVLITLPPRPTTDATQPPASESPGPTPAAGQTAQPPPGATPRPTSAPTPRPTPTRTPPGATPTPQPATLVVSIGVVNDSGGTASAADWTITVATSGTANPSSFPGSESGTTVTISANASYSVTAQGPGGYSAAATGDCSNSSVAPGSVRTCRLLRNDIRPRLTIRTLVDNSAGGTQTPADWTVTVTGTDVTPSSSFAGSDGGVEVLLDANAPFDVSMENPNGSDYSAVEAGTCDGSALALGAVVSCTITYTYEPPPEPAGLFVMLVAIDRGRWGRRWWATTPS